MGKITVLGSGGWGIALALKAFSNGHKVVLWSPFEEEVNSLVTERESKKLLPGIKIPEDIKITADLKSAENSDIIIIATPSFAVRETAARLKNINFKIVVNVAKGFEKGTKLRLSSVISEELPDKNIAVLSGPSHAEEVSRNVPTAVVAASDSLDTAKEVQSALMSDNFRIYTNNDIIGVEVGGAIKNVIAVAAGIESGLSLGDNARAALITRGLTEMARLGMAMGADIKTFMGLSSLGDLIVTCMSEHSRNNRFGKLVGKGEGVASALEKVGTVEGYYAVLVARELAAEYNIEMPITEQCYKVLYENENVYSALKRLMERPERAEEETLRFD